MMLRGMLSWQDTAVIGYVVHYYMHYEVGINLPNCWIALSALHGSSSVMCNLRL